MAESRTTPAGSEALKAGRGHRTPAELGWNPCCLACRGQLQASPYLGLLSTGQVTGQNVEGLCPPRLPGVPHVPRGSTCFSFLP